MTIYHEYEKEGDWGVCAIVCEVEFGTISDFHPGPHGEPIETPYRTCQLDVLGMWIGNLWLDHNRVQDAFGAEEIREDLRHEAQVVLDNGPTEPTRCAPSRMAIAAE